LNCANPARRTSRCPCCSGKLNSRSMEISDLQPSVSNSGGREELLQAEKPAALVPNQVDSRYLLRPQWLQMLEKRAGSVTPNTRGRQCAGNAWVDQAGTSVAPVYGKVTADTVQNLRSQSLILWK
jgi:hypothetical protein